ncbi:hypothetical protein ILUMI_00660 [Ignelater luminosus]|uniref:PiggyBac transposable element-derived protein domain-containing protein n=1 Tax=Ignelater luminosus TaxID=2038154 RepID=A0A8K0DGS9_IGNLU|nr:hypothetical protein ILUMI_00660 [Ignelater luminosus]
MGVAFDGLVKSDHVSSIDDDGGDGRVVDADNFSEGEFENLLISDSDSDFDSEGKLPLAQIHRAILTGYSDEEQSTSGYMYGINSRFIKQPNIGCPLVKWVLLQMSFFVCAKTFVITTTNCFDNLFTSVSLLEVLEGFAIYATGTPRTNRMKGADKLLPINKEMKKASMLVASTCAGKKPQDKTKRLSQTEKKMIKIDRPFAIKFYDMNMEGVDLHDKYLAIYAMRRKNRRWYISVFMDFLDVPIINAYIDYKMRGHSVKDFLQFKGSLAKTLITTGTKESKRGSPRSATPPSILKKRRLNRVTNEIRLDGKRHWPKLISKTQCGANLPFVKGERNINVKAVTSSYAPTALNIFTFHVSV